jgi:hypothetical protein
MYKYKTRIVCFYVNEFNVHPDTGRYERVHSNVNDFWIAKFVENTSTAGHTGTIIIKNERNENNRTCLNSVKKNIKVILSLRPSVCKNSSISKIVSNFQNVICILSLPISAQVRINRVNYYITVYYLQLKIVPTEFRPSYFNVLVFSQYFWGEHRYYNKFKHNFQL